MLTLFTVLMMLLTAPCSFGAEAQTPLHPDRDKAAAEIAGKIQEIDAAGRQLTIQDEANQRVTLHVIADTRVLDPENHLLKWTALRRGDRVNIYYNTRERNALQIDLMPGAADALMGTSGAELRSKGSNEPPSGSR